MRKKIFALAFATFALVFALAAMGSAYSNYHDNDYYNNGYYGPAYGGYYGYSPYQDVDRVNYHYSHDNGNTIKTTNYHKESYSDILPDGTQIKTLQYSRVTTVKPYGYGYYYQPYYRTNYRYSDPSYYRTNYRYGSW